MGKTNSRERTGKRRLRKSLREKDQEERRHSRELENAGLSQDHKQ